MGQFFCPPLPKLLRNLSYCCWTQFGSFLQETVKEMRAKAADPSVRIRWSRHSSVGLTCVPAWAAEATLVVLPQLELVLTCMQIYEICVKINDGHHINEIVEKAPGSPRRLCTSARNQKHQRKETGSSLAGILGS